MMEFKMISGLMKTLIHDYIREENVKKKNG